MATKKHWSPANTPPPLDGNWNFSVVKKGIGRGFFFFKIDITCTLPPSPLFLATKKIQSPFDILHHQMVTKRGEGLCYHFGGKNSFPAFSPFDNGGMFDGDQIFLVAWKGMWGRAWNGNKNKGRWGKKKKNDNRNKRKILVEGVKKGQKEERRKIGGWEQKKKGENIGRKWKKKRVSNQRKNLKTRGGWKKKE